MLYHQSEKGINGDRAAVLDKVEDKYNWDGGSFPTSFDDIAKFENNNKIGVNIFGHNGKNEINPIRAGPIPYIKTDDMNLLLMKDKRGKGH